MLPVTRHKLRKGNDMRKLAVAMALATTALAGPAFARDGAWYAGVEGGAMLVEDIDFDLRTSTGAQVNNAVNIDHEPGFDVGAVLGYDFGAFRVEAEVAYRDANLDAVRVGNGVPPVDVAASTLAPGTAGTYEAADGNTRAWSAMLNALLDFGGDESPWGGFVGGGVGIARVKSSEYQLAKFGPAFLDDRDTSFAWQLIAGVRRALTQNVDVGLKYRFFNVQNHRIWETDFGGRATEWDGRVRTHSLLATVTYNFGEAAPAPAPAAEPAPPPPPPPPAPAPEPAPAPVPAPGPFIVFFDWDRSDITPEAAQILDRAAEQYQQTGQASITLAGHADKSGSDQYNQALSQRRANAVRDYLVGKGIPSGVITTEAFGESRPLVETADGVREPQNRRVEINFGGGGMTTGTTGATSMDATGTIDTTATTQQ